MDMNFKKEMPLRRCLRRIQVALLSARFYLFALLQLVDPSASSSSISFINSAVMSSRSIFGFVVASTAAILFLAGKQYSANNYTDGRAYER